VPGPGTGAGGIGNGLGSGLSGNGTGGGGAGGGLASHVRWVKGGIDGRDYPRSAYEARAQGVTYVRFTVGRDGRIKDCTVTRSSGHRDLDDVTCRLILRRFRYVPARDAQGRPAEEEVRGQQDWDLGPERPDEEVDAEPER
jgi:protein TonB